MNDYLSRLASRSLNKSEVLQPRLPSIFEPQPFVGNIKSRSNPIERLEIDARISPSTSPKEEQSKDLPKKPAVGERSSGIVQYPWELPVGEYSGNRMESPPKSTDGDAKSYVINRQQRGGFSIDDIGSSVSKAPFSQSIGSHSDKGNGLSSVTPNTRGNSTLSKGLMDQADDSIPNPRPETEVQKLGVLDNPNSPYLNQPRNREAGLNFHRPSILNTTPSMIEAISIQSQMATYVKPLKPSTETLSPPPGPDIQVAIGRIEVRAVQKPTPQRKSSTPKTTGLEEYLRRPRGSG